jgi:hypothetical protein
MWCYTLLAFGCNIKPRIPDLVRNKYSSSHASGLATLDELINTDKSVTTALKRSDDHSARAAPASGTSNDPGSGVQTRTLASPDFDGADVPNFDRVVVFDSTPLDEFNATKTFLGCVWHPQKVKSNDGGKIILVTSSD